MARKKSSSLVRVKSEDFPLDNFIRLTFKKFKLTDKQKQFLRIAFDPNTKIVFLNGPAGSSKSFCAIYAALKIFSQDQEKEIVYVRTIAESGERSLGSLPGAVNEKVDPFGTPLFDKLEEILDKEQSKELTEKGVIKFIPINFSRGNNWKDKVVIFDEAQNFTKKELITGLTRIAENTKYFFCGDLMQSDINGKSGLKEICSKFDTEKSAANGIHVFNFTKDDIMRSEILKFIIEVLEKD